jgi:hypothetical protein
LSPTWPMHSSSRENSPGGIQRPNTHGIRSRPIGRKDNPRSQDWAAICLVLPRVKVSAIRINAIGEHMLYERGLGSAASRTVSGTRMPQFPSAQQIDQGPAHTADLTLQPVPDGEVNCRISSR